MANSQGESGSYSDILLLLSLGVEVGRTKLTDDSLVTHMLELAAGSCSAFRWHWMQ